MIIKYCFNAPSTFTRWACCPSILRLLLLSLLTATETSIGAEIDPADWATEWSERTGVTLEHSFDSSGPDAWDAAAHPLVYVLSEGPGYGGLLSGVRLPGVVIIDANTREVVASQNFDVLAWGWSNVFEPHGLGVSPDGKWIYLPTGEGSFATKGENAGRFLVINARTLKIDKVIKLPSQAHHAKSYRTPDGEIRSMLYAFHGELIVLDPSDDNRMVGGVFEDTMDGDKIPYLYFMSPEGDTLLGASAHYGNLNSLDKELATNIYFFEPENWTITKKIPVNDAALTWTAFTSDGASAYISASHSNSVYKLDRATNTVAAKGGAGVNGPYGVHLGWDDELLYVIGKGEHSHNRGKSVGIVRDNTASASTTQGGRGGFISLIAPQDEIYTGCVRGDHGTLHPDPEANELWISCNSSFEVVILDLDLRDITGRIPMPNGGSTHSGAFVEYSADWEGEVVSDPNGLHGSALAFKRKILTGE